MANLKAVTIKFDYRGKLVLQQIRAEVKDMLRRLEGVEPNAINIEWEEVKVEGVNEVQGQLISSKQANEILGKSSR